MSFGRWAERTLVARTPHDPGLFLSLAPMDGVTDEHHRHVMTELHDGHSGISVCVSEFVRVTKQALPPSVLLRHCPELARGGRTASGVPVFVQLLGGDPEWMARAALEAAALGALGIDLNFGCPAKTVNGSDGGAVLLRDVTRVEAVTRAVRAVVDLHIPVTVKVRVGWEDASRIADIARAAENGGAAWLTVHGRTRAQLYRPPVDWAAIGRARAAVHIPVVANGDLVDRAALLACAAESGCQAFMIGRGALADPHFFARLRDDHVQPMSSEQFFALLQRYCACMAEAGVPTIRVLGRLKQWLRMGASRPEVRSAFDLVKRLDDLEAAIVAIDPQHSMRLGELGFDRGPLRIEAGIGHELAHDD